MVAAERIALAVVEPARSQAEDQENRVAVGQDLRERGRSGRFFESGRFVVTTAWPSCGGKPRLGNPNVWNRPRSASSRRYFPASPMLVVPETQTATSWGVRRSLAYGNPNVARLPSNASATGAARAIARRCASANRTESYG